MLAAIVATGITWVIASFVIDIAPVNRELLEAGTALVAVLVLIVVSFWLIQRLEHRRRMEFMRARTAAAIAAGSSGAFMALGFTAVYREGFETVLFYQALALFAEGLGLWVVLGAVAAVIGLAGVGYAILGLGRKLPLKPMLITGASILLLLSVAFVGNAVRSLQEADLIAVNPIRGRLGAAAGVRRRADRHPSDDARRLRAARAARGLRGRCRVGLRDRADAAPAARGCGGIGGMNALAAERLRVGVDVGGTFTKAVAVSTQPLALRAHAVVPTTHSAPDGVVEGVAEALRRLLDELGDDRALVDLVAYSTTTAMNALLEGDVARVGVVGIGADPDLRRARKRTRVGELPLAAGHVLHSDHVFLDATHGLSEEAVDAALDELQRLGCGAIAVSGAYSVDAPEQEDLVVERARMRGLPSCAGHELTGTYGLEVRTVSAAVNASILPIVERTAGIVERVLREARDRRAAAGAARRRRCDGTRRLPSRAVDEHRLGPRRRRCRGAAPAGGDRGDRARVRRDELERDGRQGRPDGAARCARDGPADLDPLDRRVGGRRRRRLDAASRAAQDRGRRPAQRPRRGPRVRVLRGPRGARRRGGRA